MAKKKTSQKKHSHWQAMVNVKWKPNTPEDAWKDWKKEKRIKGAWTTTGDWDCSLWVDVDNPNDLEDVVWNKIRKNKWVEKTESNWAKQWW